LNVEGYGREFAVLLEGQLASSPQFTVVNRRVR
jgi:hypothetical protein